MLMGTPRHTSNNWQLDTINLPWRWHHWLHLRHVQIEEFKLLLLSDGIRIRFIWFRLRRIEEAVRVSWWWNCLLILILVNHHIFIKLLLVPPRFSSDLSCKLIWNDAGPLFEFLSSHIGATPTYMVERNILFVRKLFFFELSSLCFISTKLVEADELLSSAGSAILVQGRATGVWNTRGRAHHLWWSLLDNCTFLESHFCQIFLGGVDISFKNRPLTNLVLNLCLRFTFWGQSGLGIIGRLLDGILHLKVSNILRHISKWCVSISSIFRLFKLSKSKFS